MREKSNGHSSNRADSGQDEKIFTVFDAMFSFRSIFQKNLCSGWQLFGHFASIRWPKCHKYLGPPNCERTG